MKINSIRRRQGVTLLEMTIVIMIIIALISVLFVGFKMYRDGANKANCLIVLSSAQKEVRAYQALNGLNDGAAIELNKLATANKAAAKGCPSNNAPYTSTLNAAPKTVNGVEEVYLQCNGSEAKDHNDSFLKSLGGTPAA